MSIDLQAASEPTDRFQQNRDRFPHDKLAELAGRWIAWNLDGTQILAAASRPRDLAAVLAELQLTFLEVQCEYLPTADEQKDLSLTADVG